MIVRSCKIKMKPGLSTYRVSRNKDGQIAILMIQHTPNHRTNHHAQSNARSRKAHGGSSPCLTCSIGQDGQADGVHTSRRGSLDHSPDKEDRLGTTHGKSHGRGSQGNQAPQIGTSTGITTVGEPCSDCLTGSIDTTCKDEAGKRWETHGTLRGDRPRRQRVGCQSIFGRHLGGSVPFRSRQRVGRG